MLETHGIGAAIPERDAFWKAPRARRGGPGEPSGRTARNTLYPTAISWYMGANVPGKPRIFFPYVGRQGAYRQMGDDVLAAGYRRFLPLGSAEQNAARHLM